MVDGFRRYLVRPLESHFINNASSSSSASVVYEKAPRRPAPGKLRRLIFRFRGQEWRVIRDETYGLLAEFLSVIATEDLVEKLKGFALQSIDVSKRVFASSTMVVSGGANLVFKAALSVISGAAGLLNFVSQLTVFFWLLYYLIASESGGVMDHVLDMLPISKAARVRCAEVLGHAVSSVFLATAKVALFQGVFTYFLFRFYQIHFLYVSTFFAWMSAILPITPLWLSSIPAAIQLAVETRYIEAVVLTAVHLFILDYGTTAIQYEIPGQSAYLTGLSILGGMALFPSVLEGAIMGPLLMTVMIALKNLYAEFVLLSSKESR
ncbi:transmembrane protein 245-like [Asparagus officinalis]|uniref:transmembrane protein 245-like n=1 Tax=Asparagus officinalis TaxID=4686 RepID=UPI00098E54E6|nr:transmembrane protein 245-like [Asparagus officinalis]